MALQFALNRLFVVTANLGSVFENSKMGDNWLSEFEKVVDQADPDLVALHCQEIGGKDFETDMPKVNEFIKRLKSLRCFAHFDRMWGWFDKDFNDPDGFTALGSLYLFHKRVETVYLWNFQTESFHTVTGEEVIVESLSDNHFHQKERFPTEYFPVVKWSRKGYLHTRWRMFGSHILNFVNIHMFHDEDNLVALEKSPSIYCGFRRKALEHTVQRVSAVIDGHEPIYIYGDFNFRLDFSAVVKHLTTTNHHAQFTKSDRGMIDKVVYKNSDEEALITVERKRFVLRREEQFTHHFSELLQYDLEPQAFEDLKELPITFRPSYPFSEDTNEGNKYLNKRCPAWCDRILMNQLGLKLVRDSPLGCMYNMMAKDVCVGDHKPIYLFFTIASTNPMRQLPDENLDA